MTHRIITLAAVVSMLLGPNIRAADKGEDVSATLKAIDELCSAARAQRGSPRSEAAVAQRLKTPGQLLQFALMCHAVAYPQKAEDAKFDAYFDAAFWEAVRYLSTYTGRDATDALDDIRRHVPMDGGSKLIFEDLSASQKARSVQGPAR